MDTIAFAVNYKIIHSPLLSIEITQKLLGSIMSVKITGSIHFFFNYAFFSDENVGGLNILDGRYCI